MKNTKNQKPNLKIAKMSIFIFSQKLASVMNEDNNVKLDDFKNYYSDLISYLRIIKNENNNLKNENKILKEKLKFLI